MNIFITLDYEIYFGENPGTLEKCIINPTNELIRIANTYNVKFCFFVDSGYILKLKEYQTKYPQLKNDFDAITKQVKYLSDTGHDIQLHIHQHWEDSYYNGEQWIMKVNRYKLSDFTATEISDIVYRYKKILCELSNKPVFAFRAGGWCLQPFHKLNNIFRENNISVDSSVFRHGFYSSAQYAYDFRNAPDKDVYRFDNDPVTENPKGYFTEFPISAIRNSPLFFWRLFFLGRKNPYLHKPLGDGKAMIAPGQRKKLLTRFTNNTVSLDGYNAHLIEKALALLMKKKFNHMVIIGHPKALSRYSIQKLEEFVEKNRTKHNFTTYALMNKNNGK